MNDKDVLHSYLGVARESLAWKLEGLTEFEARLPRTPTGTSLLGLLKHVAFVQAGYLGPVFGRPMPDGAPLERADPHGHVAVLGPEQLDLPQRRLQIGRAPRLSATMSTTTASWTRPRRQCSPVTARRRLWYAVSLGFVVGVAMALSCSCVLLAGSAGAACRHYGHPV